MGTLYKIQVKRNGSFASNAEKAYMERNLNYFINKNKKTSRNSSKGFWLISEDRDTLIKQQLLEYIKAHFNLYELYVAFFVLSGYSFATSDNYKTRHYAIRNISSDESLSGQEKKELKQKIWDLPPIFYGMLLEFVTSSELFWDPERKVVVYPTYQQA